MPAGAGYATQLIVAKDEQAVAVDSTEKKIFKSASAEHILRRYVGLPLSTTELFRALTAQVPASPNAALSRSSTGDSVFLEWKDTGKSWELDARSLQPKRLVLTNQYTSKLLANLRYTGFLNIDGVSLPSRIELDIRSNDTSSVLTFDWRKINAEIAEELFEAREPAGYEVVTLKLGPER
jgi:hypothetical protein